jgi:PPOX class probable F420-dependent enzyme
MTKSDKPVPAGTAPTGPGTTGPGTTGPGPIGAVPIGTVGTRLPFYDPYLNGRPADVAKRVADEILAGPHLSVLATTNADGSPQMAVVFVKAEGDDIVFSTLKGRRKTRNMWRDPRANLLVHSLPVGDEASTYATISGQVELTDDPDGSFHQVMYDIHMGGANPPPEPGAERLIVRIRPNRTYAPPPYSPAPAE